MPDLPVLALLQETPAQTGEKAPGTPGFSILPFLLIGLVFYFVLIGPERKNRKKREALLASLQKGDKVVTTSGMYGQIVQVQEDVVTLQVADGVRLRFSRAAIQTVHREGEAADGEAKAR